jgi:hypothetical protein
LRGYGLERLIARFERMSSAESSTAARSETTDNPGVVADVVDDVGRRVDQALDDARQAPMEALEQLGLVAEQARSWTPVRPERLPGRGRLCHFAGVP